MPSLAGSLEPARAPREGSSSVALALRGPSRLALIALGTEDAVVTVDVAARRTVDVVPIAGGPEHVLVLADGRVAVTLRASGEVALLEAGPDGALREVRRARVGSDPFALAGSPDGKTLYVSCGFEGAVVALDATSLESRFRVIVAREPRALLVSPEGHRVYASHATASVVTSIDVEYPGTPRVQQANLLVDDTVSVIGPDITTPFSVDQGFAMAERGGRLYVPSAFKDAGPRKLTGGYGGTAAPIRPTVRTIDLATFEPVSRELGASRFTDLGNECTLPRGVVSDGGDHLYVACLGIDQVLDLDARGVDPVTNPIRRFDVPEGPTGVALDAERHELVTYASIAGSVGFVDLKTGETTELPLPTRENATLSALEKRGRHLFTTTRDTRISLDNRACESCHPDGRDDGQTWSTPDGMRQTISLAGRVGTGGKFGWFGEHGSIELHVRHTSKRLFGAGFEGPANRADLEAIGAWIRAMPAPQPIVAADDPRVAVGAAAFSARGCDRCHREGGTDERAHDVGSGNLDEASLKFDTPSLRLISAQAPLFHDGRYADLDAMLLAPKGPMSAPAADAAERDAIASYLHALPALTPRRDPVGGFVTAGEARPFSPTYPDDFRAKVLTRARRGDREVVPLDLSKVPVADASIDPRIEDYSWWGGYEMSETKFSTLGAPLVPERDGAHVEGKGILRFDAMLYGSDDTDDRLDWRDLRPSEWRTTRFQAMSWSRLDRTEDGALRYRHAAGFLDTKTGEARLSERTDGTALEICDGHALLVRVKCPDCKPGSRDGLLLVERTHLGLDSTRMSLEPGQTGRAVIHAYPVLPPKGVELQYQKQVRISLDATHLVRDPEATVSLSCGATDVENGVFLF